MISTRLITLLALAASMPLSQAISPIELDVWDPLILYPHDGTVWNAGDHHNVTWDASNAPALISNPKGTIYLVSNNVILWNNPLASGFSLLDGRVEIQVPYVSTGNYQILLFGDSGNDSPAFTINSQ